MTARARRSNESFKQYRKHLITEKVREEKGNTRYLVRHKIIKTSGKVIGNTYNVGNNQQKREKKALK